MLVALPSFAMNSRSRGAYFTVPRFWVVPFILLVGFIIDLKFHFINRIHFIQKVHFDGLNNRDSVSP